MFAAHILEVISPQDNIKVFGEIVSPVLSLKINLFLSLRINFQDYHRTPPKWIICPILEFLTYHSKLSFQGYRLYMKPLFQVQLRKDCWPTSWNGSDSLLCKTLWIHRTSVVKVSKCYIHKINWFLICEYGWKCQRFGAIWISQWQIIRVSATENKIGKYTPFTIWRCCWINISLCLYPNFDDDNKVFYLGICVGFSVCNFRSSEGKASPYLHCINICLLFHGDLIWFRGSVLRVFLCTLGSCLELVGNEKVFLVHRKEKLV